MTITLSKTINLERSPESFILESLQRGSQIGSYSLLEPIGQGGEATVWSGWNDQERRVVAIKIVTLSTTDANVSNGVSNDFRRQVHLLASLEHPHILPLYEFGSTEECFYFAMRYSSAGSLVNLLAKGPVPLEEVMRLSAQVCYALEYIHKHGDCASRSQAQQYFVGLAPTGLPVRFWTGEVAAARDPTAPYGARHRTVRALRTTRL